MIKVMNQLMSIFIMTIIFIITHNCSESAEFEKEASFKEDFSSERLSIFRWGIPTFTMYNFRGDPDMVSNISGLNYLRLGRSATHIYPSGFIYTKAHFTYGSYSARMKILGAPGAVASFFSCSEITNVFSDGTHDEIDFEFLTARPHAVLFTTWYLATGMEGAEQTPTHNFYTWEDPSFDIRKWHDYRFDWHPDRVDFYIDDIKRWTSTKAVPRRDMQIALHNYTIDTWEEVQFPPKGDVYQITDWVKYKKFKNAK